jgi:hypothetical protein
MPAEFMGQGGFVWWFGVVEDTDDPLKLGRVRVRIFGYHTDNKKLIPTGDLPWAHPVQPIQSASISGVGISPTGLLTGSHVFGFFRDGPNAQQPIVLGSVGGIPSELADKTKGFNDPTGTYPKEKDKPDTNRLATGDETDKTIIEDRKKGIKKDVAVALDSQDAEKWSEPESPYKPKYPNNKVFATKSGMVEEWDDTPEKERHHTYHPSGSFEEVANGWSKDPAGTRVHKVQGNNYEIIAGDDFIHIKGTARITLDGSAKFYVGAGEDSGDLILQVDRDVALYVAGNLKGTVEKDVELTVNGNYKEIIAGDRISEVKGNIVFKSEEKSFVASSTKDAIIKTAGGSDLFLSGDAKSIKLNCARSTGGDPA